MEVKWQDVSLLKNCFRVHVTRGPVTNKRHRTREIPIDERQKIYLKKIAREPEAYLYTGREKQPKPSLESEFKRAMEALERMRTMTPGR
jgi:DNA repair exonuclease SbcCD nuclease subunit